MSQMIITGFSWFRFLSLKTFRLVNSSSMLSKFIYGTERAWPRMFSFTINTFQGYLSGNHIVWKSQMWELISESICWQKVPSLLYYRDQKLSRVWHCWISWANNPAILWVLQGGDWLGRSPSIQNCQGSFF